MEEIIIDVSGCTTALQFLDTVGKALGKPMGNFSMLEHYLMKNYHSKIIFVGLKEFSAHCPHSMKEVEIILRRVQWNYQQEGKVFEYHFQA